MKSGYHPSHGRACMKNLSEFNLKVSKKKSKKRGSVQKGSVLLNESQNQNMS